jgi:23S rRNA (adenine2503-C2)-methyltransferase
MKTTRIINSTDGLNMGARHMTISTCGIMPGIKKLVSEGLQIELSVSLHAADDKIRSRLLPINRKYPLKELINTCRDYIKKTNRQITFEYILIKGMNSDLHSAQNLVKILTGLKLCKINLIPCNPIKEYNIEPPNKSEILFFKDCLIKGGLNITLRRPRGQDIEAACGQLRLGYVKK